MSHFSVLVIGENVEQQLQPYHEFECTGENDQYVQNIDITNELQARINDGESLDEALGYYGLEDRIIANEADAKIEGDKAEHMWGYAVVQDGNLIKAVNRTNPNRKWDWWVVGGRWSGFLTLKSGRKVDEARKGDIDFEAMRNAAGAEAAAKWDKANAARNGGTWDTWEHVRDVLHAGNIDAARQAYHAQPAKDAVAKALDHPWNGVDEYLKPRDQYIQQARDRATVLYGVVKDGQWLAKGEMGWFGMSSDDVSQDEWNRKVNEMLDALPDDTLITVVDCHI